MVNWKSKFLKYKLKYKKLKGGTLRLNDIYTGYNDYGRPFEFKIIKIVGNSYTLVDTDGNQIVKSYNEVMDLRDNAGLRVNQAEYSMETDEPEYNESSVWQINSPMYQLSRLDSTAGISREPAFHQSEFTNDKFIVPSPIYNEVPVQHQAAISNESARRDYNINSPQFHPDNLNLNTTCICFISAHGVDIGQTQLTSRQNLYTQYFTQPEETCVTIEYQNFFNHIAETLINYHRSNQAANSLQHTLNEIDHGVQFHPQPIIKYNKGQYTFQDSNLTLSDHYHDIYFFNPDNQQFIRRGIPVSQNFKIKLSDLIDNYILPECNKENIYIGILSCRGGRTPDDGYIAAQNNNCTACTNGEPPCCFKSRDGDDCAFKNFSNKEERDREHLNYKTFESNNNLSGQIPESLSEHQAQALNYSTDLRQNWMNKHLKPECATCDADCKNHLGRIKASRRALNKHYTPGWGE